MSLRISQVLQKKIHFLQMQFFVFRKKRILFFCYLGPIVAGSGLTEDEIVGTKQLTESKNILTQI